VEFSVIWIVLAVLVGFYVAFTIGANDVANAMGTSVGSKALTLMQAVLVAAIFEFLGAVLVGSHVTNTIRKGIIDPLTFTPHPELLLYGMFAALISTGIWIHLATNYGLPISTTHSIVGSIIGFGIVASGFMSIGWGKVGTIALSWIVSPALGGFIAFYMYKFISKRILNAENPIKSLKKFAPFLTLLLIYIITLSVFFKGLKHLHLDFTFLSASLWGLGIGLLGSLITYLLSIKYTKDKQYMVIEDEYKDIEKVFAFLQVISACSVAFSHGANDVANAIGPAAAIVNLIQNNGQILTNIPVPIWLLALGGLGIVTGLAILGYKVIKTIGHEITELTPTRGFAAEFAAATTVILASRLGLPVSTTHTLVGAVVGVGLARGINAINLKIMRDIIISWLITLPLAGGLTIIIYEIIVNVV